VRGLAYFLGIFHFRLTLQIGMTRNCARCCGANTAALISFLVGTTGLIVLLAVTRTPMPARDTLASVPAWAWFGGLMGAFYVAISTVVASQLGTASLLGLALSGQLAMALVVDHFGWLGMPTSDYPYSPGGRRLLGVGVWLVSR
jgi:transporter family-2 protein